MRAFVLTIFCIQLFGFLCSVFELMFSKWPKEREPKTSAFETATALLTLGLLLWAGIVLWM